MTTPTPPESDKPELTDQQMREELARLQALEEQYEDYVSHHEGYARHQMRALHHLAAVIESRDNIPAAEEFLKSDLPQGMVPEDSPSELAQAVARCSDLAAKNNRMQEQCDYTQELQRKHAEFVQRVNQGRILSIAPLLTPDQLADKCEAWLQAGGASNIADAYEAGYRACEAVGGVAA